MKNFWILIVASLLSATGCAWTPQAVVLKPEIQSPSVAFGQGQPVLLTVVDERPRSTLGTRATVGVGAELSVAGEIAQSIQKALNEGFQAQGFRPVRERTEDGRELRVEIRNLDYRVEVGFGASRLSTECGLKAICIHGNARPFEQYYRGEFQDSILFVQTAEANEKHINTAVSKAINSLLQDSRLSMCLAE